MSNTHENSITPPQIERLAYTTAETCAALGIKRTTLWRLEKTGKISAIPGLRHKLFPVAGLKRFTEGRSAVYSNDRTTRFSANSVLDLVADRVSPAAPVAPAAKVAATAATKEADCAEIDRRTDLSDIAKADIKAAIRAGKLRAADVAQMEVSQ